MSDARTMYAREANLADQIAELRAENADLRKRIRLARQKALREAATAIEKLIEPHWRGGGIVRDARNYAYEIAAAAVLDLRKPLSRRKP